MSTSTNDPVASLGENLRLQERGAHGTAEVWLWWTQGPTMPNEKLGVIGHFSAETAEAAKTVLARARETLRTQGCTLAVGPMDGNTWRKYRFVTDAGTEAPFFLEPVNPAEWPLWWKEAGFCPLAEYFSTASNEVASEDTRLPSVAARMKAAGVCIRPLDTKNFDRELDLIYDVSTISFQENYLYTPLPREAFVAQYKAVQSLVRPELLLLAEHQDRPVGYVFAVPNHAETQRGEPLRSFIVKTLAVLPGRAYAGLGAVLLGQVHRAARELGFQRVIHALMHETNKSRNLSAHYAQTIRRYTLFSQKL